MSSRRRARELALRAFYALEFSGNPLEDILTEMVQSRKEEKAVLDFAEELLRRSYEHREELDTLIKAKALNWEFDRIAVIDKLILRMAIGEFLYFPDIPPKVSIDEAIEISKRYSTEKSSKFINGILDAVLNDLRREGRLHKTGRGLDEGKHGTTEPVG